MRSSLPLFPEQASTFAERVDALYYYLLSVSGFFVLLIFALIFYFAVKYRRRSEGEQTPSILGSIPLEVAWIVIPFILVMIMFVWGASLYFTAFSPPANAMEIFVIGKQWMWKVQHPEGRREIDELHVPVGYPVKLTITSQDVIHSFYIPAFRIKMDAVPGRYTSTWFEASRDRHLSSVLCGVLRDRTRRHGRPGGGHETVGIRTMAAHRCPRGLVGGGGRRLFQQLGCSGCHSQNSIARAPLLDGVYGKPVPLQSGQVVLADESYIRDSILLPQKDVVAGYAPVMPSFQGRISEEELMQIISYIRFLGEEGPEPRKTTR